MATTSEDRGIPSSTLCPKFLHSNSTSHTWPFSAIAELIDNAYDPDVNAKQFWIDKAVINGQVCLSFMDNGNGLDYEKMLKMLSFGFSDKIAINGHQPIGVYGNGFKSGSMRLGRDAIVFSRSRDAIVVGLLSQSYLEEVQAERIIVPIVCFESVPQSDRPMMLGNLRVSEQYQASLQAILRHSLFTTEEALLTELNTINSTGSTGATGTRIIIWNLRRCTISPEEKTLEFDFEQERYDIQIPSNVYEKKDENYRHAKSSTEAIPDSVYSLRAYCSILYKKPRMQIIVCGMNVRSQFITKSLAYVVKDTYRPSYLKKGFPIIFGYNTQNKDHYGLMMYHKNRLIKAYERVGCQLKGDRKGVGVIGVIECNFLEPTHNKQDFDNTGKYRNAIISLGKKLEEYWNEMHFKRQKEDPKSQISLEDMPKRPDQTWVQCDTCQKWRKLPDGIDSTRLPEKWFCNLNPDPQFRSCKADEEEEDSEEERPYTKTHKQHEKRDKLIEKEKTIATGHGQSTSAVTTPVARGKARLTHRRASRNPLSVDMSLLSPAAFSSNIKLPIITGVRSWSKPSSGGVVEEDPKEELNRRPRVKRALLLTTENESKRHRGNGTHSSIPETASPGPAVSPSSSTSLPIIQDSDDDDDITDDDDVLILEANSTPIGKQLPIDTSKIKTEKQLVGPSAQTNPMVTSIMETAAMETSPSPPGQAEGQHVSLSTQTEGHAQVKEEEEGAVEEKGSVNGGVRQVMGSVGAGGATVVASREEEVQQPLGEDGEAGTNSSASSREPGRTRLDTLDFSLSATDFRNMKEAQEQQDQLMALMQSAANERDSFKEKVNQLMDQLLEKENRVQELTSASLKEECTQQATQTEENDPDYKSLYEQAQRKAEMLRVEMEALLQTSCAASCSREGLEDGASVNDEVALQIDTLLRDLDQINKQRGELQLQMELLEQEKASLAIQCEQLRSNLESSRQESESGPSAPTKEGAVGHPKGEAGGMSNQDTASVAVEATTLIQLRRSVGRLLYTFVPALDLDQVNYECNVIDEILEQVLTDVESAAEAL